MKGTVVNYKGIVPKVMNSAQEVGEITRKRGDIKLGFKNKGEW